MYGGIRGYNISFNFFVWLILLLVNSICFDAVILYFEKYFLYCSLLII